MYLDKHIREQERNPKKVLKRAMKTCSTYIKHHQTLFTHPLINRSFSPHTQHKHYYKPHRPTHPQPKKEAYSLLPLCVDQTQHQHVNDRQIKQATQSWHKLTTRPKSKSLALGPWASRHFHTHNKHTDCIYSTGP